MAKQIVEYELNVKIDRFTSNLKRAKGEFGGTADAFTDLLKRLPRAGVMGEAFKEVAKEAKAYRDELRELEKQQAKGGKISQSKNLDMQAKGMYLRDKIMGAAKKAAYDEERQALEKLTVAQTQAYIQQNKFDSTQKNSIKIAKELAAQQERSAKAMVNHLITQRYAFYDISSSVQRAGAAMTNFAGSVLNAAAAQEAAFSQVQKTQIPIGLNEKDRKNLEGQVKKLKNELINLTMEIPKSFQELSNIAMLGAQLNVPTQDLAKFAETIAKFSTVTGVSVDEAALSFGKLANLLKIPSDQYDELASSISYVGVNSAATEAQILSTAKQIGAIATNAGFSAEEVIGLSSALASLAIAPEEARGVLQQTFQAMTMAANSYSESLGVGNEALRVFAEVSSMAGKTGKMSAEEFAKGWKEDAGGTFNKFVEGLGKTDIADTLDKIGLAGVRTSKGLSAMGNSAQDMLRQMQDAAAGMKNGFLDESFATTADDIRAKLDMMKNSFDALLAAAGSNPALVALIGQLIDGITNLNQAVTNFVNGSPALSFLIGAAVALTGLVGVLFSIAAAVGITIASMYALRTATFNAIDTNGLTKVSLFALRLSGLRGDALTAALALKGLATAEATAGTAGTVGAAGVNALKMAIKGLMIASVVGIAIVGITSLVDALFNLAPASEPAVDGIYNTAEAAETAEQRVSRLTSELENYINMLFASDMAQITLNDSLFNFGQVLAENGDMWDLNTKAGRENEKALLGVISNITTGAKGDSAKLAQDLSGLLNGIMASGKATAGVIGIIKTAIAGAAAEAKLAGQDLGIANMYGGYSSATMNIDSFLAGLKKVPQASGNAKTALEKLKDTLDNLFSGMDKKMDLADSLTNLGKTIAENGKTFSYFGKAGRDNLKAVRDSIDTLAENSNGNKKKFANDLAAMRKAMIQAGITSGPALTMIDKAMKSIGVKGKAGKNDVKDFFKFITTGAAEASASVRTLSDYADELAGVLERTMQIKFGEQIALDGVISAFDDLTKSVQAAKDAIADAKVEILGLTAEKVDLEYQLNLAIKYGDTLREASLRAKIAENAQKLAEAERKAAEAQNATSLTGTDSTSIDNRSKVRGILSEYITLIKTLAETGNFTEAQLADKAAEMGKDFHDKLIALGFKEEDITPYVNMLGDTFTGVIEKVQKGTTLKVNTDPALRALDEFVKTANGKLNKINTVTVKVKSGKTVTETAVETVSQAVMAAGASTGVNVAGVSANAAPYTNALNTVSVAQGISMQQSASATSSVISLSPDDRALLRAAIDRPVNLYTDNQKIAQSANAGNVTLAQRGIR